MEPNTKIAKRCGLRGAHALFLAMLVGASPSLMAVDNDPDLGFPPNVTSIRINGENLRDLAGLDLSGAGDVNGDGLGDVLIGVPGGDRPLNRGAGLVYVLYGQSAPEEIDLANLERWQGFRVYKEAAGRLGLAAAGDVNGDGFSDVLISTPGWVREGDILGAAHLVYGGPRNADVDLADLGIMNGFSIHGDASTQTLHVGSEASGVGDINGDGYDDVAVTGRSNDRWTTHVVLGRSNRHHVVLGMSSLGYGFKILGDSIAESVSGAGDFNGDGFPDIVLGFPVTIWADQPLSAKLVDNVRIVYGKADPLDVDLSSMGAVDGARIISRQVGVGIGASVASAGDMNGDGFGDVMVGGPNQLDQVVYVVFGRPDAGAAIDVARLTSSTGRELRPGNIAVGYGLSIGPAGDLNKDGYTDAFVGAAGMHVDGINRAGTAVAYYGGDPVARTVRAREMFRISGSGHGQLAGFSVGAAGDTDGDGWPNLLVGAPGALEDNQPIEQWATGHVALVNAMVEDNDLAAIYRARVLDRNCAVYGARTARTAFGDNGDRSNHAMFDGRAALSYCGGTEQVVPAMAILGKGRSGRQAVGRENADVAWAFDFGEGAPGRATLTLQYLDHEIDHLNEATLQVYAAPVFAGELRTLAGARFNRQRNRVEVTVSTEHPIEVTLAGRPR